MFRAQLVPDGALGFAKIYGLTSSENAPMSITPAEAMDSDSDSEMRRGVSSAIAFAFAKKLPPEWVAKKLT